MADTDTKTNRAIRILHVVGNMNRGGVETLLMRVLRYIDRDRFHMDFVGHSQPSAYDDEIRALGSEIWPAIPKAPPWTYASRFRRLLREHGPYDVVHSHIYFYSGLVLRLAAQMKVPVRIASIYPQIDKKPQTIRRKLYRALMTRWINKYATVIMACSQSTLSSFQRICDCASTQKSVVYCGLNLNPFNNTVNATTVRRSFALPTDRPLVVYVARFFPHKNHEQIFRIANRMKELNFPVHFALIGSHGQLLENFQRLSEKRDDISILTNVADITELLLAADLFFFPSLNEGFGIVALEAAAAGLPIVATDLPTIREAVPPDHRRFMIAPNDDPAATQNIMMILSDQELRQTLSAQAKQWAKEFSIASSVDTLLPYYTGQDSREHK